MPKPLVLVTLALAATNIVSADRVEPHNDLIKRVSETRVFTLRMISWVRWPQQALLQATVERIFARWYVRNLLDWQVQQWRPRIRVQRILLRKLHHGPDVMMLRPVARLTDRLAVCDWLVAVHLGYRCTKGRLAQHDVLDAALGIVGGSAFGFAYLVVMLFEALESWGREWHRAAPVRALFGGSPHERLLATYAHRLAAEKLREHVVAVDVPSLIGLGWRLGLAAGCLHVESRQKLGPRQRFDRTAQVWAAVAFVLRFCRFPSPKRRQ